MTMDRYRLQGWAFVLVLAIVCSGIAGAMDLHRLPTVSTDAAQSAQADPDSDHHDDDKSGQQAFHHCDQCQAHFLGTLTTERPALSPSSQLIAETQPALPTEVDLSPPETPPKA